MTSQLVEFTYKQMQINQDDQEGESVLLRTLEKDMHGEYKQNRGKKKIVIAAVNEQTIRLSHQPFKTG